VDCPFPEECPYAAEEASDLSLPDLGSAVALALRTDGRAEGTSHTKS
jgi:hypothetical protein